MSLGDVSNAPRSFDIDSYWPNNTALHLEALRLHLFWLSKPAPTQNVRILMRGSLIIAARQLAKHTQVTFGADTGGHIEHCDYVILCTVHVDGM